MLPLNYHHLYYFYAVAKSGSISRACAELRLAQPTVSMQLKQLEDFLGKRLFERHHKRLVLTEDGRTVLDYAQSIFSLGREMQDTLKDRLPEGRHAIQLGILSGTPWAFTHALLRFILEEDPEARISAAQGGVPELRSALQQQQTDLVLADSPIQGDAKDPFTNRLVARIPIVFAAAPGLAARYRRFPRDFSSAPFVLPTAPSQVFHQVEQFLADAGITPRVVAQVQDVEVARRLAISGFGIAPLNAYTVAVSAPTQGLQKLAVKLPEGVAEPLYLIARPRRRANPLAAHAMSRFAIRLPGRK